jgi:hypothetical protein
MIKSRWMMMLAVVLIAGVSSCARTDRTASPSTATEGYGSSAPSDSLYDTADPYHTGRDSARENF